MHMLFYLIKYYMTSFCRVWKCINCLTINLCQPCHSCTIHKNILWGFMEIVLTHNVLNLKDYEKFSSYFLKHTYNRLILTITE